MEAEVSKRHCAVSGVEEVQDAQSVGSPTSAQRTARIRLNVGGHAKLDCPCVEWRIRVNGHFRWLGGRVASRRRFALTPFLWCHHLKYFFARAIWPHSPLWRKCDHTERHRSTTFGTRGVSRCRTPRRHRAECISSRPVTIARRGSTATPTISIAFRGRAISAETPDFDTTDATEPEAKPEAKPLHGRSALSRRPQAPERRPTLRPFHAPSLRHDGFKVGR